MTLDHPYQQNVQSTGVHPKRFALWLGMAVMAMSFAGLTSAYIVRSNAPNWTEFAIPTQFYVSAGIMLLSSLSMFAAVWAFKKENLTLYRATLMATLLLSGAFLYSQWLGWESLKDIGIYLDGNPAGSFIYVISFIHIAHVAIGILLMLISVFKAWVVFANPASFLEYTTDANKGIGIKLLATYWHFVDLLWLYLILFFTFS